MRRNAHGPSRRALTLTETIAALAILSLALVLVRLSINGLNAQWRLRAAAHNIESVVRWAQGAAASRGTTVQVLYEVPDGPFWARLSGETEPRARQALPRGVRFDSVSFANGTRVLGDIAAVGVYPDGSLDAHEIVLTTADGAFLRLTFHRLTGEVSSEEGAGNAVAR